MEFFAILKTEPGTRLRRINLSAPAQQAATELFLQQLEQFENGVVEAVAFVPNYTPEAHEILEIEGFDDEDGILAAVQNPIGVPLLDLSHDRIDMVCGIFGAHEIDGGPAALLQVFDRRRSLQTGGALWVILQQGAFTKLDAPGLTFDSALIATLKPGSLRFRSFHHVRRLFDVDSYFKEASNPDLAAFAAHPAIVTADGFDLVAMADTPIRRKVGLIAASKILDTVPVEDLVTVAATLGIDLQVGKKDGNDAFQLPNDKAGLKRVLSFLNEDYWNSPLTNTTFYATSKRPI